MISPLTIITGHYGCGKTVFAVNLALCAAEQGYNVKLADLDIVNPYFCARERLQLLEQRGVRVVLPAGGAHSDMPAVSAEVMSLFQNEDVTGIIDSGGDPIGARVLARFADDIRQRGYELLCCVNANRPETADAEKAIRYLHDIETSSTLTVTGLVNTTHLLSETSAEDIFAGARLCGEIERLTGIPTKYHAVDSSLVAQCADGLNGTVLPISIYMNKPWEI